MMLNKKTKLIIWYAWPIIFLWISLFIISSSTEIRIIYSGLTLFSLGYIVGSLIDYAGREVLIERRER